MMKNHLKNKIVAITLRNFGVVRILTTSIITWIFCNIWIVLEYVMLGEIVNSCISNIMMTLFIPIIYIASDPIVRSFIGKPNDTIFMKYADDKRVVYLPCNIGDTLYVVRDDAAAAERIPVMVHHFELYPLQSFVVDTYGNKYNFSQFGKTVFYDMCDNEYRVQEGSQRNFRCYRLNETLEK